MTALRVPEEAHGSLSVPLHALMSCELPPPLSHSCREILSSSWPVHLPFLMGILALYIQVGNALERLPFFLRILVIFSEPPASSVISSCPKLLQRVLPPPRSALGFCRDSVGSCVFTCAWAAWTLALPVCSQGLVQWALRDVRVPCPPPTPGRTCIIVPGLHFQKSLQSSQQPLRSMRRT